MSSFENQFFPVVPSRAIPTVMEVDSIAALTNPVTRNLQITQCYYELSAAFAERDGSGANWCTFATWASKQAGQSVRREDLKRTLEALLKEVPEIEQALTLIATISKQLGAHQTLEQIRQSALGSVIYLAIEHTSDAVSRGNKKVFEEIGREFARFINTCLKDTTFTASNINDFCRQLRPGSPPDGQEYLYRAFNWYYKALFETDLKKRAEEFLLANLLIGFHEQTRLQPEIAESLNATLVDPELVKKRLLIILFPDTDNSGRLNVFLKRLVVKTDLLDNAIDLLVRRVQHHLRIVLTAHLMTLTLPPDNRLHLGRDLAAVYPTHLQNLADSDLLALLARIDPTPNSLLQSGAIDWADLPERLHLIAELFRCYQETKDLFDAAFSEEQLAAMRAGKIPEGRL